MLTDTQSRAGGTIPLWVFALLVVLVAGVVLGMMVGLSEVWVMALWVWLSEAGVALLVAAAAGGYGGLLVGRIAPASAPGGLKAVTSCGLGLWMLSTAVLIAGTAAGGLLAPRVWWPVVIVGALLAAWQARGALKSTRWRQAVSSGSLVWLLVAVAVGLSVAGAMRPPGLIGAASGDAYDVLEYHLQVPREFLHAGRIGPLPHNCYSFYPLGVETLYLLGMCLRGGAYEGMYLAKLLHGLFGVLAVAAVYFGLRDGGKTRARYGAILLATAPCMVYLSWLAMVELAEVFYLAAALLWLRLWLREPSWRSAGIIGLMLGAACAAKYLSVGLVLAPVILVMLAASLRSPRRLGHAALAGAAALLLFSPWLARNAAYTGNPVFPLATSVFGRGHWSAESQQRWIDGHAPDKRPPVPRPPGWQTPESPGRVERALRTLVLSPWLGRVALLAAMAGLAVSVVRPASRNRWDWTLGGVCAVQVGVWAAFTHEMPPRFLTPAVVPIALLAGGALARLSELRLRWGEADLAAPPRRSWGAAPALVGLAVIATANLGGASVLYVNDTHRQAVLPWAGGTIARELAPYSQAHALGPDARLMLVGEATAFYFPPGTVYATVFDVHPLAQMIEAGLSREEIIQRLRSKGITHIRVSFSEISRLSATYGFPASLSRDLRANLSRLGLTAPAWVAPDSSAAVYELPRRDPLGPAVGKTYNR